MSAALPFSIQLVLSGLLVIGVEIGAVLLVFGTLYFMIAMLLSRVVSARSESLAVWSRSAKATVRKVLLALSFLLVAGVLAFNGWLMWRGLDVRSHTISLITSVSRETKIAIAIAFGKLIAASIAMIIATRLLRRLLAWAEVAIDRWDQIKTNNESLARLFRGLDRLIVYTGWMLVGVLACAWFGLPDGISNILLTAIRIYLVISVGVMVVRCTTFVVDTLEGFSQRTAEKRGWMDYYERIHPLLPTFRTCLEYALWIVVGSLVLAQINGLSELARWGPRLIQAIGIFMGGRIVIELGILEIGRRMLPKEGLDDMDRRRRETMVPLVRTGFRYAAYFGTAVLILSALGFNPMPFLAGAGILGLVIGFGAQSMIDDVVSGFFILLENTYLVGDTIEVDKAKGVVEAIEFRTTKIRDGDGRVHILRNGSIKPVINYSKEYTMAVVKVDVPYDSDLRKVFETFQAAGARLRAENPDVLAETEIEGITAFGPQFMTIRASTRVKPGRHEPVEAAMRLLMKEMFDRQAAGTPRRTLVPQLHDDRAPWPATGHKM